MGSFKSLDQSEPRSLTELNDPMVSGKLVLHYCCHEMPRPMVHSYEKHIDEMLGQSRTDSRTMNMLIRAIQNNRVKELCQTSDESIRTDLIQFCNNMRGHSHSRQNQRFFSYIQSLLLQTQTNQKSETNNN